MTTERGFTKWFIASILGLVLLLSCTYGTGDIQKDTGENPMVRGDSGGMDPGELGGGSSPFNEVQGWSGKGDLTTGGTATAGCQANFKRPGAYTVQFTITPTGPSAPPAGQWAILQAVATLRWSVAGITIVRKVTVANGMSISGVGEGVTVVVEDATLAGGSLHLGQTYSVGITVAPGTRASDTVPPIYNAGDASNFNIILTVPAVGSVNVDVPQGVGIKSVLVTVASKLGVPILEQSVQVQQKAVGKNVMVYDPRAMFFAPLMPGVTLLVLNNLTAADVLMSVVFGVDG